MSKSAVHASAGLLSGAALVVTAISGGANAQTYDRGNNESVRERDRAELNPIGLSLGAFRVFPSVSVGLEKADNVFAAQANEQADTALRAGANARIVSEWTRHFLEFNAGVDQRAYQDFGEESTKDWNAGFDGRLEVLRGFQIVAGANVVKSNEPRGWFDSANTIAPVELKDERLYLGAEREFGRIRVQARATASKTDFDDVALIGGGVLDQDFRDNEGNDLTLRADYAISPAVSVFIAGTKRWRDFTRQAAATPNRDFEATDVLVGASFDITRLVRGEVGVGYVTAEVDDPASVDVDGLSLSGIVEWFPTPLTTLRFDAARTVRESGILASANVLQTTYSARVDHELTRNVIFYANANMTDESYEGIDRTDERIALGLGADWMLNRVVTVNAGVARIDQDSSGTLRGRSFDQNVLSIGVSLHR